MKKKTVYLAGSISEDSGYKFKFRAACNNLERAGYIVMNLAVLPGEGFRWEAYMSISSAMMDACAAVCFLPDWVESRGAMYEYGRATAQGKEIFMYSDWYKELADARNTEAMIGNDLEDINECGGGANDHKHF